MVVRYLTDLLINWDTRKLIILTQLDTSRCESFSDKQFYGLLFYDVEPGEVSVDVTVLWSNSQPIGYGHGPRETRV